MKAFKYKGLTLREIDTIRAALRYWQARDVGATAAQRGAIETIAQEHGEPLSLDAIDSLCERINTGEAI